MAMRRKQKRYGDLPAAHMKAAVDNLKVMRRVVKRAKKAAQQELCGAALRSLTDAAKFYGASTAHGTSLRGRAAKGMRGSANMLRSAELAVRKTCLRNRAD